MPKYTREQVINERRCGLKFLDAAIEKIGKDQLFRRSIELAKGVKDKYKTRLATEFCPATSEWEGFDWAISNAASEALWPHKEVAQPYNADEVFSTEELKTVQNTVGYATAYVPSWKRKEKMSPYRENAKMPDRKPQAGDVVRIKSGGGPTMTIAYIDGQGRAACRYFDEKHGFRQHECEVCILKVVDSIE